MPLIFCLLSIPMKSLYKLTLIFLLPLIVFVIYQPGISGPFLFDDITSINTNSKLKVTTLDANSIYEATFSGYAGPLKRPVAMLSFALNYYFSGEFKASAFKITNIAIHCINSVLVFFLSLQLLSLSGIKNTKSITILAAAISTIWAVHPINLTSVLYIVQRMTSLSTLFSLGCIILYIVGRGTTLKNGIAWRGIVLYAASFISLIFALFSKENAILIPLIILLIELTLFSDKTPWSLFNGRPYYQKALICAAALSVGIFAFLYAVDFAAGGFNTRPFTMAERVLTEARVLCLYISLILAPRINELGLFHDDIVLSSSLLAPWTTITSIIFILGLVAAAFYYRNKNPLFTLGIGWFFIGHLLESTIFPLEIAHEHRNNLPSIGIIIAVLAFFQDSSVPRSKLVISCITVSLIFGSITWYRSTQWSDPFTQALYETIHHPKSPSAHTIFANIANKAGHPNAAIASIEKAMELSPHEIALPLYYQHILISNKLFISNAIQAATLERIKQHKITPSAQLALSQISDCLPLDECKALRKNYLGWIDAVIEKHPNIAYYYLFKGKAHVALGEHITALNVFQNAFDMDQKFLHPLFEIADILLKQGDIENAKRVINWLKEANEQVPIRRDDEILQLEENLRTLSK